MTALLRRVCSWWTVGAAVTTSAAFGLVALRLNPPAFAVVRSCTTLIAVSLTVKVFAWVAVSGGSFGREERLAAFVALASIGLGWLGAGQWIAERDFDYRAAQQKAELVHTLADLSIRLTLFLDARDREAPPRPRAGTWQQDVDRIDRFETATVVEYERRFGPRVRTAHDLVALRGVADRDFEAFFRHPANAFQMRILAKKLAGFSAALGRRP